MIDKLTPEQEARYHDHACKYLTLFKEQAEKHRIKSLEEGLAYVHATLAGLSTIALRLADFTSEDAVALSSKGLMRLSREVDAFIIGCALRALEELPKGKLIAYDQTRKGFRLYKPADITPAGATTRTIHCGDPVCPEYFEENPHK